MNLSLLDLTSPFAVAQASKMKDGKRPSEWFVYKNSFTFTVNKNKRENRKGGSTMPPGHCAELTFSILSQNIQWHGTTILWIIFRSNLQSHIFYLIYWFVLPFKVFHVGFYDCCWIIVMVPFFIVPRVCPEDASPYQLQCIIALWIGCLLHVCVFDIWPTAMCLSRWCWAYLLMLMLCIYQPPRLFMLIWLVMFVQILKYATKIMGAVLTLWRMIIVYVGIAAIRIICLQLQSFLCHHYFSCFVVDFCFVQRLHL